MSLTSLRLTIRGIPENQAIREVNVRSGPNINYLLLFKAGVGMSGLPVLDVAPDEKTAAFNGKIYQWFRVVFPNGQEGWVRDDLADIIGDGTSFGYPVIDTLTYAFTLARKERVITLASVGQVATPEPSLSSEPILMVRTIPMGMTPSPNASDAMLAEFASVESVARVRKAAFNITGAFEGGGYSTYQSYDSGIISYGRFQFTLAAGSFITVINRYLERSTSQVSKELLAYSPRIVSKDQSLRNDTRLKELCIQAAQESIMQEVQDEVAAEGFYQPVFELSVEPRGIALPLSQALVFDIAINHGRFNHLLPKTEEVLGVPNKSRLGLNGVSEQIFTKTLASVRRDNLYGLADKLNLPGLKRRGDFWVKLVEMGDWTLQGDSDGNLNINGKIVQVRYP